MPICATNLALMENVDEIKWKNKNEALEKLMRALKEYPLPYQHFLVRPEKKPEREKGLHRKFCGLIHYYKSLLTYKKRRNYEKRKK